MKIPFLDLTRMHHIQSNELNKILEVTLLNEQLLGGNSVKEFEVAFANYLDTRYCISCGNGTDALEIILRSMEIGSGDEVIVPANGWLSAAEMVKLVNATPVFADTHESNYTIDPKRIEASISPYTKAIIPIHLYGHPADMPAIMKIAEKHKLPVIEDCAQAHGASVEGKKVGSWGHAAAFSFYPTKNLGALGDAGAMVTSDQELAHKCRMIANHGQVRRDEHQLLGRNSRMDTLQAAVLNYRLDMLDVSNQKRRLLAQLYRKKLEGLPLALPVESASSYHSYHLFVVRTPRREALRRHLHNKEIGTMIHYPQAVSEMRHLNPHIAPIAARQSQEILSLPLYPELTEQEVEYVSEEIRNFFNA